MGRVFEDKLCFAKDIEVNIVDDTFVPKGRPTPMQLPTMRRKVQQPEFFMLCGALFDDTALMGARYL